MIRANLLADARGRILRARLRGGNLDVVTTDFLQAVAREKEERHHIGEADFVAPERSMSCIGG